MWRNPKALWKCASCWPLWSWNQRVRGRLGLEETLKIISKWLWWIKISIGADLERSQVQGRCCTLKVWLCDSTASQELVLFPGHVIVQNWILELLWMFLCMVLVWSVEGVQCAFCGVMKPRESSGASPALWELSRRALGAQGLPQTLLLLSGDFCLCCCHFRIQSLSCSCWDCCLFNCTWQGNRQGSFWMTTAL